MRSLLLKKGDVKAPSARSAFRLSMTCFDF